MKTGEKNNVVWIQWLCCCFLAICTACVKDVSDSEKPEQGPWKRTLLVYMAADNNLYSYAYSNLADIEAAVRNMSEKSAAVVVYLDTPYENPQLFRILPDGTRQVLKNFSEKHNSVSPEVMAEVIGEVCSRCPAQHYGLVLWSHATSWLPANSTLLKKNIQEQEEWPETKTFGQDTGESPTAYMELEDLKNVLPDGLFDYILFDACYMGSVEVAYALRNKADYIVASPTEVLAGGFPYSNITEILSDEIPDLEAVCRAYYEYYNTMPGRSRAASIGLVATKHLENLATISKEIVQKALTENPNLWSEPDLAQIPCVDRSNIHFAYDLDRYMVALADEEQYEQFSQQLDLAIPYSAHTPYFFDVSLQYCCGLTAYIPLKENAPHNPFYFSLDWGRAVYGN